MSITYYFTQPNALAPQTKARSVDINALSNAILSAFNKIPVSDQVWSGAHDFTAGTVRVPAPVVQSDAASKGYVDTVLMTSQGKFTPPPAIGTYNFVGINGVVSWQPAKAIFDDTTRLAQAQATALCF